MARKVIAVIAPTPGTVQKRLLRAWAKIT